MARYHASPHYIVGNIEFDMHGTYETEDAKEITALDALVPTWISREQDETKAPVKEIEKKAEEPAVKSTPKPRKPSGNASAK